MFNPKNIIIFIIVSFFIGSLAIIFFSLNFKSSQPMELITLEIKDVPIKYLHKAYCNSDLSCNYESFNKSFQKIMHELEIKIFEITDGKYVFKKNTLIEKGVFDKYSIKFRSTLDDFFDEYLTEIKISNDKIFNILKSEFYKDEIRLENNYLNIWKNNYYKNVRFYLQNEAGLYNIFANLQRFYDAMFFLLIISIVYLSFIIFRKK